MMICLAAAIYAVASSISCFYCKVGLGQRQTRTCAAINLLPSTLLLSAFLAQGGAVCDKRTKGLHINPVTGAEPVVSIDAEVWETHESKPKIQSQAMKPVFKCWGLRGRLLVRDSADIIAQGHSESFSGVKRMQTQVCLLWQFHSMCLMSDYSPFRSIRFMQHSVGII